MTTTVQLADVKKIVPQVLKELEAYVTGEVQLSGGDIVSSFQNVVCMDYRLPISALPDGLQDYFNNAKKKQGNLFDIRTVRHQLHSIAGL